MQCQDYQSFHNQEMKLSPGSLYTHQPSNFSKSEKLFPCVCCILPSGFFQYNISISDLISQYQLRLTERYFPEHLIKCGQSKWRCYQLFWLEHLSIDSGHTLSKILFIFLLWQQILIKFFSFIWIIENVFVSKE